MVLIEGEYLVVRDPSRRGAVVVLRVEGFFDPRAEGLGDFVREIIPGFEDGCEIPSVVIPEKGLHV